ncbi:DNA-3-methyladenine glycosylase I [Marinobacter sp.]|uniref:DNA-3-methyladenine glycosylase I n=1 Tax=Marinobacter sp. TaxID=50741 RepID=UPI00356A731A
MEFSAFYQQAVARKGGEPALKSMLPAVPEKARLMEVSDDRYLSLMTSCIFRAGFVWRVIDNKWPDFEAAFEGFVPAYWQQVPVETLEQLAADTRIVRNMQKIRTVPENARMIMDVVQGYGSFGRFLAEWPNEDQVGLLLYLKRNGARLGGNSAQYFLRQAGWDGFIMSHDVVTALTRANILDASPSSKKGLAQAQQAFNQWHKETGLPISHLSKIVSFTVDNG